MRGFVNLNKPKGMSSAQAVGKVRFLLGGKNIKAGHAGTLDPLATGVLPIAIGRATRLFDYLQEKQKHYLATFQFGYTTDTLDSTGTTTQTTDYLPTKVDIIKALPQLCGNILQTPPIYSAKSINGQRAYDLARNGQEVNLEPCEIEIFNFDLLKQENESTFLFNIVCSKGTYIRSLCRDLANLLHSYATMINLQRTQSGVFNLENAINIEQITENNILPIDFPLKQMPLINISKEQESTLLFGKSLYLDELGKFYTVRIYVENELIGIGELHLDGLLEMKTWLK